MKIRLGAAILATTAFVLLAGSALAAAYSLFGDAQIVSPGHNSPHAVQAVGNANTGLYGGVDFSVPAGTTFANITNLALDYEFTQGDCGLGSPRFAVEVQTPTGPKNAFFYIGPPPSYTGCPPNVWTSSGNLATPISLVDTSQLGGTFYEPKAAADATFGSYPVTDIAIVSDNGSPAGSQTVLFDNVQVGGTTYTFDQPASKDECKSGGWQQLTRADGSTFKNQGDCIQYANTGK